MARHNVNKPSIYIRTNVAAEPVLNDKTLKDVVSEVVTKPMRTAEVVQTVVEAGWQTTMILGHFRTHVISRLRQAGFWVKGGKWVR